MTDDTKRSSALPAVEWNAIRFNRGPAKALAASRRYTEDKPPPVGFFRRRGQSHDTMSKRFTLTEAERLLSRVEPLLRSAIDLKRDL